MGDSPPSPLQSLLCAVIGIVISTKWFLEHVFARTERKNREPLLSLMPGLDQSKLFSEKRSLDSIPVSIEVSDWDAQSPVSAVHVSNDEPILVFGTRYGLVYELRSRNRGTCVRPPGDQSLIASSQEDHDFQENQRWWNSSEILGVTAFGKGYIVVHEVTVNYVTPDDSAGIGSLRGALCVSPGKQVYAFGLDRDRLVRLVDPSIEPFGSSYRDHELNQNLHEPDGGVGDDRVCEVRVRGDRVMACCGRYATVFHVNGAHDDILFEMPNRVTCVALSDAGIVVTTSFDGTAASWDVKTGSRIASFERHRSAIYCLDLLVESGQRAVTGSGGYNGFDEDFSVWVWDTRSGSAFCRISSHSGLVSAASFAQPRGRFLTTAGWDGHIRQFDLCNRERTQVLALAAVVRLPEEVLRNVFDLLA